MITNFIPCPGVDGASYISLYHDHQDPYTIYYINNHPRITVNPETKKSVFDYMVIGRGIKKEGSNAVQEGRLVLSVNLALTDDEMQKIENAVRTIDFNSLIAQYYPKYDTSKIIPPSPLTRIKKPLWRTATINNHNVTIRPVDFTSGKATINLASSDVDGKFTKETKPSLFGDCNATFAANYDAQESQILYQIFKPHEKDDKSVNLSAVIEYELKYDAFMPFIAKARIKYDQIYSVFKNKRNSHAGLDSKYRGEYILPKEINNMNRSGRVYCNGADLYISKEDLYNYLNNNNSITKNIEIEIEGYNKDENNDKYEELIIKSLGDQLADKVCDMMFEHVQPLDPNDIATPHDVETGQVENTYTDKDGKTHTDSKKKNVAYDIDYRLRNIENIEAHTNYDFTITKNKAVEFEANPNQTLELLLKGVDMNTYVRELDASDIYFQEMVVPVRVDNTNFERDIAIVSVRVIYKDKTGATKMDRVFNFDKDNPDTKTFSVIMSRDDQGKLIDKFYYSTMIRYRGYDVYRNMSEDQKWTPLKECSGIGSDIYVPYVDMRNLCVECTAGDVAWNVIQKLDVEFKYRDAPDQYGATKTITLTQQNPIDTWNCFMYKGTSDYTYRIHYFYLDGTDDWSQEYHGNDTTKSLTINDKLTGIFTTNFDLLFKRSDIDKVRVIVKCQGKEEYSPWFDDPDMWQWQIRLKEDREKTYQYKYQYYVVGNDERQESEWSAPVAMSADTYQQTIELKVSVNRAAIPHSMTIDIDGGMIDWKKWFCVILHFKYDDPTNNLHYGDEKIKPIKLKEGQCECTVEIPVLDDSIRPRIIAEYVPPTGDVIIPSEEKTANTYVILPAAAPPTQDVATPVTSGSSSPSQPIGSSSTPAPAPEPAPEPVIQDLNLTFSPAGMDWEKWYFVAIHIKYDDDVNGIHYNDDNCPTFKIKQSNEDKVVTIQIKNPAIQPRILAEYVTLTGDTINSDETPISGTTISLPDAVPPKA